MSWPMPLISNHTGLTGFLDTTCTVELLSAVTLCQSLGMPPMPALQLNYGALDCADAFTMSQAYTTSVAVMGLPFDQCQDGLR